MSISKSFLIGGAAALISLAGLARVASAETRTYVVCNTYSECWRVHKHYSDYPADMHVTWHDDAWWAAHQNDAKWHFEVDPTDDHGWYDKTGVWVTFPGS